MARAKPQFALLDIPLTSGLSQKEDPRLVAPGQALTIQNFQKLKAGTIQKPLGYTALPNAPNGRNAMTSIIALATNRETLLQIAPDGLPPGLFKYASQVNQQEFLTRVPQAYIGPSMPMAAYDQPVGEMDQVIIPAAASGQRGDISIHVFTVDRTNTNNFRVYWCARDDQAKTTIIQPQEISELTTISTSVGFVAPKLIAMNANVVLTVGTNVSNTITAYTLNVASTLFPAAWGGGTAIITDAVNPAVYDVATVDDDSSTFVVAYQNATQLLVRSFTNALGSVNVGHFTDASWSNATPITGWAVHASANSGGAWLAYGWTNNVANATTTWTASVRGAALNFPALSAGVLCTPVDLTNGLVSPYPGPQLLDVKPIPNSLHQQVVWSPPNVKLGYNPAYVSAPAGPSSHPPPQAAIFQSRYFANFGTGTLANNQPRWTNGVTLASRMQVMQEGPGHYTAWLVGWVPSSNLDPVASGLSAVSFPNTAGVLYPPYVTFTGGVPGLPSVSGGAQATAELGAQAPNTWDAYTYGASNFYAAGTSGWNTYVNNVNISSTGSGYANAPRATMVWGAGAYLLANVNANTGYMVAINPTGPISSTKGSISWTAGVGTITQSSGGPLNVYPEMIGATITLTNCTTGYNNGTFVIQGINPPSFGYADVNINVIGSGTGTDGNNGNVHFIINNNNGEGYGYNPEPNTVPVWVLDAASNHLYTDLAMAQISPSGITEGQVSAITLTAAAANVNFLPNSLTMDVQAFIPYPQQVSINVTGGVTNAQSSAGYLVQGTATLGQANAYRNLQGSFFLFCMDTFDDVITVNTTGAPYTNCPMRWIGSLKPRFALNNLFATAHVLPHLQVGASAIATDTVFADLPINIAPNVAAPTAFELTQANDQSNLTLAYQSTELGGETAFAAGAPFMTDGSGVFEFAFPYYPENLLAYAVLEGVPDVGDLTSNSVYQYIATYAGRDLAGNEALSARSVPSTVTTLPVYDPTYAYQGAVVVPTMGFSMRNHGVGGIGSALFGDTPQNPITIHLARTTAGGTEFYDVNGTPAGAAYNDLWSPYVLIQTAVGGGYANVPFVNDTQLSTQALLYGDGTNGATAGSILDNLTPPSFQGMTAHKNRLWGFDGPDVYYSKAFTSGEQPAFNDVQAFSVDDGSFPVTALASMDERLIIFKRDRIFYVTGDGPDAAGNGNDLQPPQRIQSNTGCVDWRSVVTSPMGTFFLGDDDLCLLTRQMTVQPLGYFVADIMATYPTITSAALDVSQGQVMWTFAGQNSTGIMVIYSYALDYWATQLLPYDAQPTALKTVNQFANVGIDTQPTLTLGGASQSSGYLLAQRNPQPLGSATANYFFQGAYWQGSWASPWIHAPGEVSFMSPAEIVIEWDNLDPHQLTVSVAYDDSPSVTDTWTVSAAGQSNVTTPTVRWSFMPSRNLVKSMQIQISDSADANVVPVTGQGPLIYSVTVKYGTLDGMVPTPTGQRGNG